MRAELSAYVHGYSAQESRRLDDQATALEHLLHHDSGFPAGSRVLEVGCGTGAQTISLARRSPHAEIVAMDISAGSVAAANNRIATAGLRNVQFVEGDIFYHGFEAESFDHIFICFVLEHLPDPARALACLRRLVRPGGTITAIEGDHGTACHYPESAAANSAVSALVSLQRSAGGNANIGRSLHSLFRSVGLKQIRVLPRVVYTDDACPEMADAFTRRTFCAMIEAIRQPALAAGIVDAATFDEGISALKRAAAPGGAFHYTFFKALAAV